MSPDLDGNHRIDPPDGFEYVSTDDLEEGNILYYEPASAWDEIVKINPARGLLGLRRVDVDRHFPNGRHLIAHFDVGRDGVRSVLREVK